MQSSWDVHLDPGVWKYFQAMQFVRSNTYGVIALITLLSYPKYVFHFQNNHEKNGCDSCVGQNISQQIFHTFILYGNKTVFPSLVCLVKLIEPKQLVTM